MEHSGCWCVAVSGSLVLERIPGVGDDEAYAVTERSTCEVRSWLGCRSAARGWLRKYMGWTDDRIETELRYADQWAKMMVSMTSLRRVAASAR